MSGRNPDTILDWIWVVLAYGVATLLIVLAVAAAAIAARAFVQARRDGRDSRREARGDA